jgi:hypothetical protein
MPSENLSSLDVCVHSPFLHCSRPVFTEPPALLVSRAARRVPRTSRASAAIIWIGDDPLSRSLPNFWGRPVLEFRAVVVGFLSQSSILRQNVVWGIQLTA